MAHFQVTRLSGYLQICPYNLTKISQHGIAMCFCLYMAHFEGTHLQICPYNLTKIPQHGIAMRATYNLPKPPDLPLQPYRGSSGKSPGLWARENPGPLKNNVQFFGSTVVAMFKWLRKKMSDFFSGHCNGVWSRSIFFEPL